MRRLRRRRTVSSLATRVLGPLAVASGDRCPAARWTILSGDQLPTITATFSVPLRMESSTRQLELWSRLRLRLDRPITAATLAMPDERQRSAV